MTCKTQAESQDRTGEPVPFEKLWRSHSTAICTDWIAQHIRIATHYCRTHRFDAPVPLHKVSQRMQNTKKKASAKKRKSQPEPSVPPRANRTGFGCKATTPKTVARASQLSPQPNLRLPEKTQCFVQIGTFTSHPWCSNSNLICQQWPAKHNQNRKTQHLYSALLLPFSTLPLLYL